MTREREVLAAKTKLHDQMGAGLTAIRQSLAQENADYSNAVRLLRQAVNAIWNDNQIYDVKDYISRLLEQLLFPELPHYL